MHYLGAIGASPMAACLTSDPLSGSKSRSKRSTMGLETMAKAYYKRHMMMCRDVFRGQ